MYVDTICGVCTGVNKNSLALLYTLFSSEGPIALFSLWGNGRVPTSAGPDPHVPPDLGSGSEYTDLSVLRLHAQGYGSGSVSMDLEVIY